MANLVNPYILGAPTTPTFFNDVRFLLNADGLANGTTAFTDLSNQGHTITTFGNTDVQSEAVDFDGTGDYLTVGAVGDFNFLHNGTRFTIEFWVIGRPDGVLWDNFNGASGNRGFGALIQSTGEVRVLIGRGSAGTYLIDQTTTFQVPNDLNVHHIVIEWDWGVGPVSNTANALRIAYDGANVETFARNAQLFSTSDASDVVYIGRSIGGNLEITGGIHAIRVTKDRLLYDLLNQTTYTYPAYDAIPTAEVATEPVPVSLRWLVETEASDLTANATTGDAYLAQPHLIEVDTGEIVLILQQGPDHATNTGTEVTLLRSTDYGRTFPYSTRVVIATDATYSCRNASCGCDPSTGRLIVFYRKVDGSDVTQGVFFRTSTDDGATWSSEAEVTSSLTGATTADKSVPFGQIVSTSNGLAAFFYSVDFAEVLFSTDGGLTWGTRTTVYDTTGTAPGYTEPYPVAITSNNIVVVVRKNTDGQDYAFYKSSNGGTTWSSVGEATWTSGVINTASPAAVGLDRSGNVITVIGARSNDYGLYYSVTPPSDYFTDPRRSIDGTEILTKFHTMRQTGLMTDSELGYPSLMLFSSGQNLVIWTEGFNTLLTRMHMQSLSL